MSRFLSLLCYRKAHWFSAETRVKLCGNESENCPTLAPVKWRHLGMTGLSKVPSGSLVWPVADPRLRGSTLVHEVEIAWACLAHLGGLWSVRHNHVDMMAPGQTKMTQTPRMLFSLSLSYKLMSRLLGFRWFCRKLFVPERQEMLELHTFSPLRKQNLNWWFIRENRKSALA